MNRSEIDILKEVVDAIVYKITVTQVELLTGAAKIYTCNTIYLNTGKIITIDSVKYRITEFLDNTYIIVKPVKGTTLPSTSLTEFTVDNPIFYDGTPRRVQIENVNDKEKPDYQGPIIWLLNWVDILPPEDKRTSIVRSTIQEANLFFLDDCNREDWNQEDHRKEVWKPMENLMWIVYKALEQRQDIFHRDIQQPERRFHANFGEYLTNKGYDGTILTGAWSGVQATLDIPFIIDICDDCEKIEICKPARFLIEGTTVETIPAGGDLNITIEDQDGNTPDYDYDPSNGTLTVQTGGASINVSNSNDTYSVNTSVDLELPDTQIQFQVDGVNVGLPQSIVTLDPNTLINIQW